ncbi:MAG: hypothetical protein ACKOTE_13275 [Opitutaceae bacterium]
MRPASPDYLPAWSRLVRATRALGEVSPDSAPFGFATRVAALGLAARAEAPALIEAFALRALALAGLVAGLSLALGFADGFGPGTGDDLLALNDTVSVVLALVD